MNALNKMGWASVLAATLGLVLIAAVIVAPFLKGSPSVRRDGQPATARLVVAPTSDAGPSAVNYGRLEQRIASLMRDPDMVGLAVGTVEHGHVRFLRGFGSTLAGSGEPVTPDTVFRWASLSKGVATAVVVGLAAEGKLRLDTPVARLGTTLTLPGDARRVTVADIMSHRTGLVRNAWDERLEAGDDPKMLRAALGTLKPECAPVTCYAYQNIAFDTVSEIIERVTGEPYASVAQTRLLAPLGMANASIGAAGLEGAASWARPHHSGGVPTTVRDSYYRIPAAGGVNSSIRDLTRWMLAQMGEAPRILSPAMLDTMHRPRVSTPPHGRRGPMDRALKGASYGLGWRSFTYAGHFLVGHRGSVDGYGSLILFDPAEKSGIVMLWNSYLSKPARLQLEFFDMLYGLPPTDWLELDAKPEAPESVGDEATARQRPAARSTDRGALP